MITMGKQKLKRSNGSRFDQEGRDDKQQDRELEKQTI